MKIIQTQEEREIFHSIGGYDCDFIGVAFSKMIAEIKRLREELGEERKKNL